MLCAVCGHEVNEGTAFCTNCGAAVPVESDGGFSLDLMNDGSTSVVPQDDEVTIDNLGASLEAAVEANKQTMESIESRAQAQVDEAFKDFPPVEEGQPEVPDGNAEADATAEQSQPAADGGAGGSVAAAAAGVAAGAAAAAATGAPFYQQDVSPNAHYSSQRVYGDGNVYGQNAAQAQYQPPSYGQSSRQYQDPYAQSGYQQQYQQQQYQQQYQQPAYGQPQPQDQMWADSTATTRAFAMVLYISGLIGMIIGLCVRDRYDAFITHHLNNVVVIFLGCIIGGMLCIVLIGFLVLLYMFVMTIMGMVSAYNGDMRELPLIGKIHIIR